MEYNTRKRIQVGPERTLLQTRVKDRHLMHSIGGADSYDEESLVEHGVASFLKDHWRALMLSGSPEVQIVDEQHQHRHTADVLDHCASACRDAMRSVREGPVDVACWEFLERTFDFQQRPFLFKQPQRVQYVGSARIGTVHGFPTSLGKEGIARLQVVLEIPSECFDDKDYLNHRYHAKRIVYLSHILQSLTRKKMYRKYGISSVEWCRISQDPRKPNLCMRFEGIQNVEMYIGTAIPVDTFPLSRLMPDRNNLRSHRVRCCLNKGQEHGEDSGILAPTPMYNGGIVEDMISLHRAEEIHSLAQQYPLLGDVVTLLMAWADTHGLLLGNDGLREDFFFEIVKIVLADDQVYSAQRMHLFRGALQVLSHQRKMFSDTNKAHTRSYDGIPDPPDPRLWRKSASQKYPHSIGSNQVLCLDGTGWMNITRQTSMEAMHQLQECAKSTINALTTMPGPDALDTILMQPSNAVMLFDVWCNCKVESGTLSMNQFATDAGAWKGFEDEVKHVASKALGDRATFVRILHSPYKSNVDSKGRLISIGPSQESITLCCRLHPFKCTRSVDMGPPATSSSAANEFRQFWGSKSELRRFQDGKICESVVWRMSELNKFKIIEDVLKFILPRHTPVTMVDLPALSLSNALVRSNIPQEIATRSERLCFDCATRLGKMLRSLDQVTLGIVNIQPVSSVHRNTALYPPIPHELVGDTTSGDNLSDYLPRCLPALEMLCQLEGSGKWPDAPAAYQKMKSAIGVQLALSLLSTFGIHAMASENCIDVFFEGFVFRLLLYSERDLEVLQKQIGPTGWSVIPPLENIPLRQSHQGLISSIAAGNPSFQLCCRLAKLWVAQQFLGNHINEEATELVCAAAYSTKVNIGGSCPSSPELGFLSFLYILANHPWEAQPLVLDVKDAEESARLLLRLRASGKAPAMFIVMPSGGNRPTCTGWTQRKPEKIILFRARTLARKCIKMIANSLLLVEPDSFTSLPERVFNHSMKDYDILIHLKAESLSSGADTTGHVISHQLLNGTVIRASIPQEEAKQCMAVLSGIPRSLIRKRGIKAIKRDLLIGFKPVDIFIDALEEKYKDIVIVCADIQSAQYIGLKIRPKFLHSAPFSPTSFCSIVQPCESQNGDSLMVRLKYESFAQDIFSLGAGLVDTVEYCESL